MLEGASVNELNRPRTLDLIPADNADSCHSTAVVGHYEAVPLLKPFHWEAVQVGRLLRVGLSSGRSRRLHPRDEKVVNQDGSNEQDDDPADESVDRADGAGTDPGL